MRPGSASDPLWYKDAVIYELHVRAFYDSNGDGVGDFVGLTEKLDYLQSLGVSCLWLLPFYPSPLRDDGYDIANYEGIHPSYGTMRDFRTFLREAHERGMQVVTELVINHTSNQHPWFQAARRAPAGSSKRNFYVWSNTNRKYEEARIIFTDSEKSNWTWDDEAGAYYWHRFFHHQPDLNFDNPRVRRAVMKVMKFWLDMGVDGLRLDAIPYLIEREGTNCENLPETHEILKEIRREVDASYANRMLLAEANQWPPDVRAYFGDGDECHMAFNFPLMPRIFMALRQEDRHPIVNIISQTPDIPENCQWAIFLRNHDELTLEMVTDEERDYMYSAYAADPQMRINIGIRRRLAPLMENNRDRIELLYSLLFSLPGTPVIYYGDEIGMGDNIYLGDRNGVRTPMQWTGDRNAGFSRADPGRLFAPPVMDAVYGYQGLNVEAQERSPFSLLNWTRQMIALRKRHRTFGRGTLTFVRPANRKILAYVREYEGEQILCVCNLSRHLQPVELDLGRFEGRVPIEMLGHTPFPRITNAPYQLALAPYGFAWFLLQPAPEPLRVTEQDEAATVHELLMSGVWDTMLDGHVRRLLERDHLLPFITRQRWFRGKARTPTKATIRDWGVLVRGREPIFLTLVEVEFSEGPPDTYFLPFGAKSGDAAAAIRANRPGCVIARLTGARKGVIHEALTIDVAQALLDAIAHRREIRMRHGTFRAIPTSAFDEIVRQASAERPLEPKRLHGEQSNTSVTFGEHLILKVLRRVEPGINPEYEIGVHLTERVPFPRVPRLAAALEYRPADGSEPVTLGVAHQLVPHQANAWDYSVEEIGRYFDRVVQQGRDVPRTDITGETLVSLGWGGRPLPQPVIDTVGGFLQLAEKLGQRTAELHLALAKGAGDPAFEPQPFDEARRLRAAADMHRLADIAFDGLVRHMDRLSGDTYERARHLIEQRDLVRAQIEMLRTIDFGIDTIRIHGDYHLGQVLWSEGDFVILDFEGEPLRAIEERRDTRCALKDVAGMLRSCNYAAYAGLFEFAVNRPPAEQARFERWSRRWALWNSVMFVRRYRETTAGARFVPADPRLFQRLLDIYLLEKALYEINYELNNRPDWVRIPIFGLLELLNGEV